MFAAPNCYEVAIVPVPENSYCSGTGHVIDITNEIRSFMDLEILLFL